MELTMYDKLLQLPLFQGMSKFDFTDILEKVKIHFNKYEPGSCLVRQDTPCNQLIFVLDGEVQIESKDRAHQYTIWETFKSILCLACVLTSQLLTRRLRRSTH